MLSVRQMMRALAVARSDLLREIFQKWTRADRKITLRFAQRHGSLTYASASSAPMKLGHRHDRSGGLMDGVPTLGGTGHCDAGESVLIRNRARKFRLQTDWCW